MIDKLSPHYSYNTPFTVHDDEAGTVLELVGRHGAKMNEIITDQNELRQETENSMKAQNENIDARMESQDRNIENIRDVTVPADVKAEIQRLINAGEFDSAINLYMNNLNQRVDSLLGSVTEGSTVMDAEVIDIRTRANGKVHDSAGNSVRAIDEDLNTEHFRNNGATTLFNDVDSMTPQWGGKLISSGVFTSKGNVNGGLGTPTFLNPKKKMYIHLDITSDRAFGGIIGVMGSDYSLLKQINTISGYNVYEIDCTNFTNGSIFLVFGHNGQGDSELTWKYTIHELSIETSILRDNGINHSRFPYEFLLKHENRLQNIDSENLILNDITKVKPMWTTTPEFLNGVIKISDIGDKGIVTPYLNVDSSSFLRISFDIELAGDYSANVYISPDLTNLLSVEDIKESGHYDIVLDPAYYPVYTDVDTINYVVILHHTTGSTALTTKISNLKIWQNKLEDVGLSNNIVDSIVQLATETETDEYITNYLVSPAGEKYVAQVDSDGTFRAIPVIPNKALFLGNSLLLGFGEYGMASSKVTKDYYYLVNSAIKDQKNTYTANRHQSANWESFTTIDEKNQWLNTTLTPLLTSDLELVLIQLGDNVNTEEKLAVFPESAIDLLKFIRTKCPKARVCWVGAWYQSQTKMDAMINACKKTGSLFINIWDLHISENESAVGNTYTMVDGTVNTISSEGVASHPGDAGMKAIANRILYSLGISETENYYS